jgi:hypothetical protein
MSMKNLVLAGVAATLMAGSAVAGEPVVLSDSDLDNVNGGGVLLAGASFGVLQLGIGEVVTGGTLNQQATLSSTAISPNLLSVAQTNIAEARNDTAIVATNPGGGSLVVSGATFAGVLIANF